MNIERPAHSRAEPLARVYQLKALLLAPGLTYKEREALKVALKEAEKALKSIQK